ncbi:MAG: 4Fe-4S binding protein, partial [Candidatus Neomarinimicrobiota bacterium]
MAKARRWVQVGFLLFFILLFIIARYPYSGRLPADIFLRFSPLIPLFDFIDHLRISLLFWPALIILVLTPFLGRFFCGWICPLGTTLDVTSRAIKPPDNRKAQRWRSLRPLKYVILFSTVVLAIFSLHVWGFLDPLAIFNRALTVVLYPLATLVAESTLVGLSKISFLEGPANRLYDGFKALLMPEPQAHFQQVFWVALFFGAILALEKLSRRFWCRNLCPAGALLGFLSQFRFYERLVSATCPDCGKCYQDCKMNAIPEDKVTETNKVECIECFNCSEKCPPKAKAISYRWHWRPYHTPIDYSRR